MKQTSKPQAGVNHAQKTETGKSFSGVEETIKSSASSFVDNIMWSFTGSGSTESSEINKNPFEKKQENPQPVVHSEGFVTIEAREDFETKQEIKKLIELVKQEIKLIEQHNKMLITEAAKVTLDALPEKPGIYHVRFFEWLLGLLRDVRKKVTESGNWLAMARGKQKRMGYWGLAQKHGTKYTMSSDRTPATSTG
jgi:hypothetical protein